MVVAGNLRAVRHPPRTVFQRYREAPGRGRKPRGSRGCDLAFRSDPGRPTTKWPSIEDQLRLRDGNCGDHLPRTTRSVRTSPREPVAGTQRGATAMGIRAGESDTIRNALRISGPLREVIQDPTSPCQSRGYQYTTLPDLRGSSGVSAPLPNRKTRQPDLPHEY